MAKNPHKLTYSIEEAAEFLEITTKEVMKLTTGGHLTQYSDKGRKYYLGGGLDAIKNETQNLLRKIQEQNFICA